MAEWYRNNSWTKDEEEHFFVKLARARKDGRPQYLKIQALELVRTKDKRLCDVAEMLINKLLTEYPEDIFERASALNTLAEIYQLKEDFDKAIKYYRQTLDFESTYPKVQTNAYLDYSELVIKTNRIDLFDEVETLLLEHIPDHLFPVVQYKGYMILSIINQQKGNASESARFAILADRYATRKTSGLRYHSHLGVVKERDSF